MEKELARIEALTDMQLLDVIMMIDDDPAPQYIKDLIMKKINAVMNDRLGLRAELGDL